MKLDNIYKKYLTNLWQELSLDIRETENGRWFDQKVTPDVMSAICDVITRETRKDKYFCPFKIQEIWQSNSFEDIVTEYFNKPHPKNPKASSEYDKFIAQPLNVLAAAGLLEKSRESQSNVFNISSDFAKNLIAEIAYSEMIAHEFLYLYIMESLRQSGIINIFNVFFNNQDAESFDNLKQGYTDFITTHTKIKTAVECRRIFSKVLNICALTHETRGTLKGHLSKTNITLNDIRYNTTNLRDNIVRKPKDIPRQIWELSSKNYFSNKNAEIFHGSTIRKVINDVKHFHNNKPEIEDSISGVETSSNITVQAHHIFPQSEYPELRNVRENIILLTPTQHTSHAHGGNGVSQINPVYQAFCLLEKLESVESCKNSNFYSFGDFKRMLSRVGILSKNYIDSYNIKDVKREIITFYGKDSK